ncbi:MAG: TIGR01212 family radical SAM protein [Eubacteriales bacterium]
MQTWGHNRYYTLDHYIKETYKEKLYKISLNGNMTCPNRDGTISFGGCIFCSEGGSGDFAGSSMDTITMQLEKGKDLLKSKTSATSYIAYFQAFTNTYGSLEYLHKIFYEAIADPSVKILSIATRPDCLSDEILDLLTQLNSIKPVWIELGLQTASDSSADFIRRGYPLSVFEHAVNELNKRHISIIVHTIMGLPSEEKRGIIHTIRYLNTLPIQGIKLQLLHVLEHTDLALHYKEHPFWIPTLPEFLELLGECICELRPDIVIHRITGDGPKDILIEPKWTGSKHYVLNSIAKFLKEEDIWQGKNYY